jgi:hypothetical protein
MHCDRRVDQVTAQRAKPRQSAILVRAGQAAEADDVGGQDRRNFPGFAHTLPSAVTQSSIRTARVSRVLRVKWATPSHCLNDRKGSKD